MATSLAYLRAISFLLVLLLSAEKTVAKAVCREQAVAYLMPVGSILSKKARNLLSLSYKLPTPKPTATHKAKNIERQNPTVSTNIPNNKPMPMPIILPLFAFIRAVRLSRTTGKIPPYSTLDRCITARLSIYMYTSFTRIPAVASTYSFTLFCTEVLTLGIFTSGMS
jgi:hypothetical protein